MTPLAKVMADTEATLRSRGFVDADELDREARKAPLQEVVRQLPRSAMACSRDELLARVHVEPMHAAVQRWEWGSPGLVLLGLTGAGKTSAAAWLVRRLVADAYQTGSGFDSATRIRWVHAARVADAIREWPLGSGTPPIIRQCERAALLIVDDAGWDVDPAPLSKIFNTRYEHTKPTMLTSAKKPDALAEHYGAPVIRRLLESAGSRALVVQAWDHDWLKGGMRDA